MEQVQVRHKDGRAIERSSGLGVLLVRLEGVGGVEESVVTYHVATHVVT